MALLVAKLLELALENAGEILVSWVILGVGFRLMTFNL